MTAAAGPARDAAAHHGPPGVATPAASDTPPHDLAAEASVVGAMMMSATAIDEVAEVLDATDFYRGAHRTIDEAITRLRDAGEAVDLVTVSDELRRRGHLEDVGGCVALADLLSLTPTAANALYYVRIVADCALRRRVLTAAAQIARTALHPDPSATAADIADQAEALLHEYTTRRTPGELTSLPRALAEQLARLEALEGAGPVPGLATGCSDLDRLTTGLQPGSLVLLAARRSARPPSRSTSPPHVAVHLQLPVALFSLEMSCSEIVQRILAAEAKVPIARLRTGQLSDPDWEAVSTTVGRLSGAALHLDDSPGLSAAGPGGTAGPP